MNTFTPSQPETTVVTLTERQKRWLNSRGGRTMNDVCLDEETGELFVWMRNGELKVDVKVGIPSHQSLVDYDIQHYRGE